MESSHVEFWVIRLDERRSSSVSLPLRSHSHISRVAPFNYSHYCYAQSNWVSVLALVHNSYMAKVFFQINATNKHMYSSPSNIFVVQRPQTDAAINQAASCLGDKFSHATRDSIISPQISYRLRPLSASGQGGELRVRVDIADCPLLDTCFTNADQIKSWQPRRDFALSMRE